MVSISIREAIRSMWTDTCDVYEYQDVKQDNGRIIQEEMPVLTAEPCRISFARLDPALQGELMGEATQTVKLFIDEGLVIKPNSKIVVTRKGIKFLYANSGKPAIYDHHQEITLTPLEERA